MRVEDVTDIDVRRVGEGFGLASMVPRVEIVAGGDRRSYAIQLCDADSADAGERDLIAVYASELERLGVSPPRSLDDDVSAAVVAFVPGAVRWADRVGLRPESREWHLFRFGLRRAQAVLAS